MDQNANASRGLYLGPERRASTGAPMHCFTRMFDEMDFGVLLLSDQAEVAYLNFTARQELDAGHPLQLLGRQLRARHAHDVARLHDALAGANKRGIRRLLALGEGRERVNLTVTPLGGGWTLLMTGRRHAVQRLALQHYANQNRLTGAESRVLEALSEGHDPGEVAELHEVKLATVRTQIGSIRAKTGAANIRELLRQVAMLPPMVEALRCG